MNTATRQIKQPPGPDRIRLGAVVAAYEEDRLGYLNSLAKQYGGLARFSDAAYLVSAPQLVAQVLSRTNRDFVIPFNLLREPLTAERIAVWMRQRAAVAPGLHRRAVASHLDMMVGVASAQATKWPGGQPLDVVAVMEEVTSTIIARYCFGTEGAVIPQLANKALAALFPIVSSPLMLPSWLPSISRFMMHRAIARLKVAVLDIIRQRTERPIAGDMPADLLDLTRLAGLSDHEIVALMVSILLAAHGVPAAALAWIWCLLAQHPASEAKLHDELDTVLRGRLPRPDDLPQLSYTEQVVREALRLYPPSWLAVRKVVRECELGGYLLLPGQRLLLCPYVTQRSPDYFDQPNEFVPERWSEEMKERLPKFAYFPFGGGPRVCLGSIFATTELVAIVATIGQRYRLRLPDGVQVQPNARRTLVPDGARMIVTPR